MIEVSGEKWKIPQILEVFGVFGVFGVFDTG